jgi:enoyl-CoA hydratase
MNNLIVSQQGWITTVTINRPKALNALNQETLQELVTCFETIGRDESIRVVILTGAGDKAFVAGADISAMSKMTILEARDFGALGHKAMQAIENIPQTVIAAINGFALGGGCEISLACDIRYGSTSAKFGQPEVNLGVIPGFGGTQRLPRIVGKGIAHELVVSGKMIDAGEALRIGLLNKVVAPEELMTSCQQLAETIVSRGPLAVKLCKDALRTGLELDLKRACAYEAELFALCFASPDQAEGMSAFLEKRKPNF